MDSVDYSRVADLYDSFVHTSLDIPFFLDECAAVPGPVLELMSGTGRVSLPLAEAGFDLTCVDVSPEMLAVLRRKLGDRHPSVDVREMDVRELSLERRFSLILIPFHSFAELLTEEDQRRVLHAVRSHLAAHGRFICTLHNPAVRLRRADGRLRLLGARELGEGQGKLVVWALESYDPDAKLLSTLEFFEEYDGSGRMRGKRLLEVRSRAISREQFLALADEAGLRPLSLYGDYSRGPFVEDSSPFMLWTLTTKE